MLPESSLSPVPVDLAVRATRLMRELREAVSSPGARDWQSPAEIDRTLATLTQLSAHLAGVLDQGSLWLELADKRHLLRDDRGRTTARTMSRALGELSRAVDESRSLSARLDEACQHTTHLTVAGTTGPAATASKEDPR
jgi:hypothetical protein